MDKALQKNLTWFMSRPQCAFSNLRVSHPDVFISRHPESNFLAEMAKLGDDILLIKKYGYLTTEDFEDVQHHIKKFFCRHYETSRKVYLILDIEHLEGSDSKARKQYLDYLKNSDAIGGMVFYNLSTLFKFSYKLTRRLHLLNDRLHAVDTYPQALDLTRKLIAQKQTSAVPPLSGENLPESDLLKTVSDRNTPLSEMMGTELKMFLFNIINRLNGVATQFYVEELLRHIQAINWYEDGFEPPDSSINNHPYFRKVIDAIGFIKTEIDTLLNERAEAERSLREREAKYRQLVEHAKAGILEYDYSRNRIIHVNDHFLKITGYSKDEMLLMNPLDLLTEESRTLFLQRLKKLMSGEKISQDIDYQLITRTGTVKWVLFNTYIFYDNELPEKANVVVTDLSRLKLRQHRCPDPFHPDLPANRSELKI